MDGWLAGWVKSLEPDRIKHDCRDQIAPKGFLEVTRQGGVYCRFHRTAIVNLYKYKEFRLQNQRKEAGHGSTEFTGAHQEEQLLPQIGVSRCSALRPTLSRIDHGCMDGLAPERITFFMNFPHTKQVENPRHDDDSSVHPGRDPPKLNMDQTGRLSSCTTERFSGSMWTSSRECN